MSNSPITNRVIIAKSSDSTSHGSMTVVEFNSRDQLKRGVMTALKCLGVAVICVGIPGAHFILVPLTLFVVTPLATYLTWRVTTKILSATIDCPKCRSPLTVLTSREQYPLFENCSSCHRQITITRQT